MRNQESLCDFTRITSNQLLTLSVHTVRSEVLLPELNKYGIKVITCCSDVADACAETVLSREEVLSKYVEARQFSINWIFFLERDGKSNCIKFVKDRPLSFETEGCVGFLLIQFNAFNEGLMATKDDVFRKLTEDLSVDSDINDILSGNLFCSKITHHSGKVLFVNYSFSTPDEALDNTCATFFRREWLRPQDLI